MTTLYLDFETRSTVDLKEAGLDNYAKHPTTDAWCMAWAVDNGEVHLWTPRAGDTGDHFVRAFMPEFLATHLKEGATVVAHNAAFELAIWNEIMAKRYGWPVLRPEQTICTMAMAYAMSLPGSLDGAAAAVGLTQQKDMAAHRLMLQMARPRGSLPRTQDGKPVTFYTWWDEPEKLERLYAYCKQDVEVERALYKRLVSLSQKERAVWLLDQKINQRGIQIDTKAINAAIKVVAHEQERLNNDLRRVTDGAVTSATEVARLTQWVRDQGVDIPGLAKAAVLDTLRSDDLPDAVRAALLIRQEAGKASTAKLRQMLNKVSADGRLRGGYQYHGANTGRWAARGVQLHNFPRVTMRQKDVEAALEIISNEFPAAEISNLLDSLFGPPMKVLPSCLRAMIVARPGNEVTGGDFSNIEGRKLAWLAGEEWKVKAFADFDAGTGYDLYVLAYARAFNIAPELVDEALRQIGKVMELALGFGGGVGAFQTMAKGYGVQIDDARADVIKNLWREAHPKIKQFWYDLEAAAIDAVLNPGMTTEAGHKGGFKRRVVRYKKAGSFLWCRLPSGRVLCYPYPKIMPVDTPWGQRKDALTYMTELSPEQMKTAKIVADPAASARWQRIATYGGSLSENVTQASSRDILVESMLRTEACNYYIVGHTHDEQFSEVPIGFGSVDELKKTMVELPSWAAGLPVAAKCWRGKRYQK